MSARRTALAGVVAFVLCAGTGTACKKESRDDNVARAAPPGPGQNARARALALVDASANGTMGDASPAEANIAGHGPRGIATGVDHTCVWMFDGSAWCWGKNEFGQVAGDRAKKDHARPVRVVGLESVESVSPGTLHTCALLRDHRVQCWGSNAAGQLGDGSKLDRPAPTFVSGLKDVVEVAAGHQSTCARLKDGTVECWGWNGQGQLGDGSRVDRAQPMKVSNVTGAKRIGVGGGHACALLEDGSMRCWGRAEWGQLGDGQQGTGRSRPQAGTVAGVAGAVDFAMGFGQTCAVDARGGVSCWGGGEFGQLGTGKTLNQVVAEPVVDLSSVSQVALSGDHSCALLRDGTLRCWGANGAHQLGPSVRGFPNRPPPTPTLTGVARVACGSDFTCALTIAGAVLCWGKGQNGQLGDGDTKNRSGPVTVRFEETTPRVSDAAP